MFHTKNDINKILESIDTLEEYIEDQNGQLQIESTIKKQDFKIIENKVIELAKRIQEQRDKDMKVFGEMMLVCEKVSDGFTEDKITQTTTDHKINYIAKSVNSMVEKLDTSLNKTFEVLNQYKEQDFRNKVDIEFFRGGKLQELLVVINSLQEGIIKRIKDSYESGNILLKDANTLFSDSQSLLSSSKSQIREIEETIQSLESIKSNIQNNISNTSKMQNSANDLKKSSKKSKVMIEKTNETMKAIDETTIKVTDAISVISQIAFQTNILSLNAAVEAATAGEAGKGFAVVAGEVRNLASRSADAATLIGNLMDELKQKTQEGSNTSIDALKEYETLDKNIDNTFELIQNVVQSINQQQSLISTMNESIKRVESEAKDNEQISTKIKNISKNNLEAANALVQSTQDVKF